MGMFSFIRGEKALSYTILTLYISLGNKNITTCGVIFLQNKSAPNIRGPTACSDRKLVYGN